VNTGAVNSAPDDNEPIRPEIVASALNAGGPLVAFALNEPIGPVIAAVAYVHQTDINQPLII
jgi:hypothetical protein